MSGYLKGLGERISNKEDSFTKEIDIDCLVPSVKNFYGMREIEELAESIKESGLMHNLVVREKEEGIYEIVSGERRYKALKSLNYTKVPCKVLKVNDLDAEIALINANAKARELTHMEKMEGINRLKEIYKLKKSKGEAPKGKTRDLIGKDIGLSGVQVGRYMKVSEKLTDDFKDMLNNNEITLTQAVDLSNLSKEEQSDIYENVKGIPKEDAKLLIEGIKQPVSKSDTDLIPKISQPKVIEKEEKVETVDEPNEVTVNSIEEELKNLLEIDSTPKVILGFGTAAGVLKTRSIKINDDENGVKTIVLHFADSSFFNVPFKEFKKVDPDIMPLKLRPKNAYTIYPYVHLWFKSNK